VGSPTIIKLSVVVGVGTLSEKANVSKLSLLETLLRKKILVSPRPTLNVIKY